MIIPKFSFKLVLLSDKSQSNEVEQHASPAGLPDEAISTPQKSGAALGRPAEIENHSNPNQDKQH